MLEELKKIRTLLEPKTAPSDRSKGLWGEFMDFISKHRVLGLAVGFIMGLHLGTLVQALVKDFIMPIIGTALTGVGIGDLAAYKIPVPPTTLDSSGNPPAGYIGARALRSWRFSGSVDCLHHRSLRDLSTREGHQEMRHGIAEKTRTRRAIAEAQIRVFNKERSLSPFGWKSKS